MLLYLVKSGIADFLESIPTDNLVKKMLGDQLPRVETQSEPECKCGCDGDAWEEVGGEFVVAGCDTAEVFETAEGVFDQVAASVAVLVVADDSFPVAPPRNDGNGSGVP